VSQPLFVLGTFFVIVVYFAPTGLTGLGKRVLRKERV
jgi:branched-chain amino acid transport system permease protein